MYVIIDKDFFLIFLFYVFFVKILGWWMINYFFVFWFCDDGFILEYFGYGIEVKWNKKWLCKFEYFFCVVLLFD